MSPTKIEAMRDMLRNISPQDFLKLGQGDVAYVRPVQWQGKTIYAVSNASGDQLFAHDTLAGAIVIAQQNEMETMTVH